MAIKKTSADILKLITTIILTIASAFLLVYIVSVLFIL
jgi:hypothetical protein